MQKSCFILFVSALTLAACASQTGAPDDTATAETLSTVSSEPEANSLVWRLAEDGLQHVASGYICPASVGDFALTGEESYDALPRSRDVACIYDAPTGGAVKFHLTDFGRAVSPAAHLKGTATTIAETYTITEDRPVPATPESLAITPHAAAWQIGAVSDLRPDVPVETAVWISVIGPWHIKARATYEADRAPAIAALIDTLYGHAGTSITPDAPSTP